MSAPRLQVAVRRLPHAADLPLPAHATAGSAGMDLHAALEAPLTLAPGKRALVPCGLAIALPQGAEAQVRPRSGLANRHGVTVLNAPGTIDSDYRGEVAVLLINLGEAAVVLQHGDRIAQLVVAPVARVAWQPVEALDDSARAGGGFGSTGSRPLEP